MKKAYHSCFIVDVKIAEDAIQLEDSTKHTYYIDVHNEDAIVSFKTWFKEVFLKGVAQTLTIFSYSTRQIEEGVSGMFIEKFLMQEKIEI